MKKLKSFATEHPVGFATGATIIWFVLELTLTGMAASALRRPYGDALTATLGRLVTTAGVLWLTGRLGWLRASGITRLGGRGAWLLALGGMITYAAASLYAFYGRVAFDFSNLMRSPAAHTAVLTHLGAALSEEILFRGLLLYSLARLWGDTPKGRIGSVLLSSLLFAVLHLTQVFTSGASLSSVLILSVEAWIIAIWWGALALWGGSVWPAVLLHFAGNALVAVQGLTTRMLEPETLVYTRLLCFSLPLGLLGVGLLLRAAAWRGWLGGRGGEEVGWRAERRR